MPSASRTTHIPPWGYRQSGDQIRKHALTGQQICWRPDIPAPQTVENNCLLFGLTYQSYTPVSQQPELPDNPLCTVY